VTQASAEVCILTSRERERGREWEAVQHAGELRRWATCPRLIQSSGAASIMCSAPWCTSSVVTDKAPRLTGRA